MWPRSGPSGSGLVILLDLLWQRRRGRAFDDTLLGQLDRAICLTAHHVWQLKNIFWWYLLPFLACITLLTVEAFSTWPAALHDMLVYWLVAGGVYWLNQLAIRLQLQPRLTALSTLRNQLLNAARPVDSSP